MARHFRRDDNAIPPTYVLQPPGSVEAPGPEEATLTSVLRGGAQEAWRLGLISQEQWKCYNRSGEAQGTPGVRVTSKTTHITQDLRHTCVISVSNLLGFPKIAQL